MANPTSPPPPAMPSPLYAKLRSLALAHAQPRDMSEILSIRSPDAVHIWGHRHCPSLPPELSGPLDNYAFWVHMGRTGALRGMRRTEVRDAVVDEHTRTAVVRMSYFTAVHYHTCGSDTDTDEPAADGEEAEKNDEVDEGRDGKEKGRDGKDEEKDEDEEDGEAAKEEEKEEGGDDDGEEEDEADEEILEQNLLWLLRFTNAEDPDRVRIRESIEFIDSAEPARLPRLGINLRGNVSIEASTLGDELERVD